MAEQKEKKSLPAQDMRDLFFDPKVKSAIEKVIPRHLTPQKLLQVAVTVVRRNYQLMQCTKQSLLSSVMGAAILGLELEPALGQAYLVPYRNKRGFLEAQLIPGYRGYISLASRSGEIHSVTASEVYTKDTFEYELGLNPKLKHIPAEGDRGEFRGAYVVFEHKEGPPTFEYMSKDRIDRVMNRTKSKDKDGNITGPWITDYEEMAKKTVIRHRAKYEPISIEFAKAREIEERAIMGESQLDLLPAPEEPMEGEIPGEPESPGFDELVKAKAKEGKDISHLKDFIQAVTESVKGTKDEGKDVKVEAAKDFDNFWAMYEKWMKEPKIEEPPKGKPGRKLGSKNKTKEEIEQGEFVDCPDRGQKVHTKVCDLCEKREGCPAFV